MIDQSWIDGSPSVRTPWSLVYAPVAPMSEVDEADFAAALQSFAGLGYGYDVGVDPRTGRTRIGADNFFHLEIGVEVLSRKFGVCAVAGIPEIAYREGTTCGVEGPSVTDGAESHGWPRGSTELHGRDPSPSACRRLIGARQPTIAERPSSPKADPADASLARDRVLLEPVMDVQVGMAAGVAAGGLADVAVEALRSRRGIVRHRADRASAHMILASVPLAELADHGRRLDGRLARRAWCDIRYGGYRPVPDGTKPGIRPV